MDETVVSRTTLVVARWKDEGIDSPGATAEQLDRFEAVHALRLPSAMRALYLISNGMRHRGPDAELFAFFQLEEIEQMYIDAPVEQRASGLLIFADWLIASHEYAVRVGCEGTPDEVFLLCGSRELSVAPTFVSFLELYLQDSPALYAK